MKNSSDQLRATIHTGMANTLRLIVIACPLVILAFLLWASNRGFDITDEGYYLLSARSPDTVLASASFAYLYVAAVFHLLRDNITALRIVGYVFILLSSCALWAGVRAITGKTVRGNDGNQVLDDAAGLALTIAGSLLIYVWFLVTPSYNLLNAAGINFFAGSLLVGLAAISVGRQHLAYVLLLAAGFVLGFCVFVKFPSGILLALVAIIGIFLWPAIKLSAKSGLVSCLIFGLFLWCLFHFFVFQPPRAAYLIFTRGVDIAYILDPRHTLSNTVTRSLTDIWQLVRDTWGKYGWLYVSGIGCAVILKSALWMRAKTAACLGYLLPFIALVMLILIFKNGWFWGGIRGIDGVGSTLFGFIMFGVLWILADSYEKSEGGVKAIQPYRKAGGLSLLFLISLPFVQATGTNNMLYMNMVFGMGPWAVALWIMFKGTANAPQLEWPRLTIPAVFGALIVLLIISGSLYYPYRLVKPLTLQTVPTKIGNPPTTLRLDAASNAFIVALERAGKICGIGPKSHVLGFYDVPGIVFALGAESAGVPWYNGGYPGTLDAADRILSWVPRGALQTAFFITTGAGPIPEPHDYGMGFPRGYHVCSELRSPYNADKPLEIWQPG